MSQKKKYTVTGMGIKFDGKLYPENGPIELTDAEAAPLKKYLTPVKSGTATPAKKHTKSNPDAKDKSSLKTNSTTKRKTSAKTKTEKK